MGNPAGRVRLTKSQLCFFAVIKIIRRELDGRARAEINIFEVRRGNDGVN